VLSFSVAASSCCDNGSFQCLKFNIVYVDLPLPCSTIANQASQRIESTMYCLLLRSSRLHSASLVPSLSSLDQHSASLARTANRSLVHHLTIVCLLTNDCRLYGLLSWTYSFGLGVTVCILPFWYHRQR